MDGHTHTADGAHHERSPKPRPDHDDTKADIEKLTVQCEEYLNGWKRALADYENYKRDSAKRLLESEHYQLIHIVNQILPMIDTLEETIKHVPADQKKGSWYQGLLHALKHWHTFTAEHGIKIIESLGHEFDPRIHEAIQTEHAAGKKEHEITSVLQQGYAIGDHIIRPSKVTVNTLKNI